MFRTISHRLNLLFLLSLCMVPVQAQFEGPALGAGPWIFDNFEEADVRLSVVARGLANPFGMVFLPGTTSADNPLGDLLISERNLGRVRHFKDGVLLADPVADFKSVWSMEQVFDLVLHPRFAENGFIYFTWIQTQPRPDGSSGYYATTMLSRARWNGEQLVDPQIVFEAQAWSRNVGGASSRMHFLEDGTLLFGVSHRIDLEAPQRLDSHIGKILRLNDDGTVPQDNPFIGVEGALPEIYAWGIRSVMDFATHPQTGEVWELENGAQGGDEVNILRAGNNYGWPIATYGRDYDGTLFHPQPWVEGTEPPELAWLPSITVASMHFYTGEIFANWKNNLFVTSMIVGRVPGTGHLQRVVFNENGEIRREQLFNSLKQRIRYVTQGPDDLIYLLTDHRDGVLLRLEPASSAAAVSSAGEELNNLASFAASDCAACHRTDGAVVGPSYRAIAERYDNTEANIEALAARIVQGGAGAWGEVPMNPHPGLDAGTVRDMVLRILSLSNN
jgi:aldose sugar dehydrogenase